MGELAWENGVPEWRDIPGDNVASCLPLPFQKGRDVSMSERSDQKELQSQIKMV
jgi:hypothetical protein